MTRRGIRRLLRLAIAGSLAAGIAVVWLGATKPFSVSAPGESRWAVPGTTVEAQVPERHPPLSEALAASQKRLQRPLVDPPPPAPPPPPTVEPLPAVAEVVKPAPPPKPPPLSLVGTVVEPGGNWAFIRTGKGKVEVRQAGELLESLPDVRVIRIDAQMIVVEERGTSFEITAPEINRIDAADPLKENVLQDVRETGASRSRR